jgi:hypothetical protein
MARTPKPAKTGEKQDRDTKGRFQPGVSGNPAGGGRPKGSVSITKHLREALEAQDEKQAKQLAQAIILQAAKGNGAAMKAVLDRIDGPVVQKIEAEIEDVSLLTDEERANRALALLERARARRAGQADDT